MQAYINQWLNLRESEGLYRRSKAPPAFHDYKSNDYYKFSVNKELAMLTEKHYYQSQRFGSGSSRMVAGLHSALSEAEDQVSKILNVPAATLLGSGYMSNLALADLLKFFNVPVFSAAPNHRSLVHATQLSKQIAHLFDPFDLAALEQKIEEFFSNSRNMESTFSQSDPPSFVVMTESVFSMSGRTIDFSHLIKLQDQFGFFLMIDDAHGFGVGHSEFSHAIASISNWERTTVSFTGSKSLGSAGGVILSSDLIKQVIENIGSPLIYSTATHPFLCCQLLIHLQQLKNSPELRKRLWQKIRAAQILFKQTTDSPIFSLVLNPKSMSDNRQEASPDLRKVIEKHNLQLMRYPTVPRSQPMIRISINIDTNLDELAQIAKQLKPHILASDL